LFFDDYSGGRGRNLKKNLEITSTFWPHKDEIKQNHIENPQQAPTDKNLVAKANRRLGFVHPLKTLIPLDTLQFERDDHKRCDVKVTEKDGDGPIPKVFAFS
jgi:hypothetical protein